MNANCIICYALKAIRGRRGEVVVTSSLVLFINHNELLPIKIVRVNVSPPLATEMLPELMEFLGIMGKPVTLIYPDNESSLEFVKKVYGRFNGGSNLDITNIDIERFHAKEDLAIIVYGTYSTKVLPVYVGYTAQEISNKDIQSVITGLQKQNIRVSSWSVHPAESEKVKVAMKELDDASSKAAECMQCMLLSQDAVLCDRCELHDYKEIALAELRAKTMYSLRRMF